jgi:ribosomal protein S18 acetylase RimI-like enzyme
MIDLALLARVRIEPLDRSKHDRAVFSCGDDRLDNFLKNTAARQHEDDLTRVNVCCLDDANLVIGYYALNSHFIDAATLPEADRKKLPSYPTIPAIYLSKIGIQIEQQGNGLGQYLMNHALRRCIDVANIVGAHFVILDALNENAARLYRRLGFVDLPGHEPRMIIKMGILRKATPRPTA